jgi:hypothetical protein
MDISTIGQKSCKDLMAMRVRTVIFAFSWVVILFWRTLHILNMEAAGFSETLVTTYKTTVSSPTRLP